jgi:hypothetical protein
VELPAISRIIPVVAALCLPQAMRADTIIFRNEVLYGKILAETVGAFRFRLNCTGRVIFVRKAAIVAVRHNNRCVA